MQPPYYPQDPQPRKRSVWRWLAPVLITLAVLAVCGIGVSAINHDDAARPPAAAVAPAARVKVPPATIPAPTRTGGAAVRLKAGDHAHVKAGTYTTDAPADAILCTWQRVRSLDHESESFIAGDVVSAGTTAEIVVKASDGGLLLDGPCVWTRK